MANLNNKYAEVMDELKKKGTTSFLDSKEDIQSINDFNEKMEEVDREYQIRSKESEKSASKVLLTH